MCVRITPTNVAPSVILEGEDYGLKGSINAAAHREPGLSAIRWTDLIILKASS